ncbi:helix-turn-helix transcriptional regulator [Brachybacterium sp. ACRRE]|uniref:helix-turn-helix transcriptional regulator n=1 Tax=Brachybacterium sp. ACRRE TaxID=2918184 RepID=UPI00351CF6DD
MRARTRTRRGLTHDARSDADGAAAVGAAPSAPTRPGESTARRVLRVKDLLDRDFAGRWDLGSMARAAHLSPTHFRRCFLRAFGRSPSAYLTARRIERAQWLLRTSDLPITQIARHVGYESLGTFTRTFHRMVGRTPSAHRSLGPPPGVPACVVRSASTPHRGAEPTGESSGRVRGGATSGA